MRPDMHLSTSLSLPPSQVHEARVQTGDQARPGDLPDALQPPKRRTRLLDEGCVIRCTTSTPTTTITRTSTEDTWSTTTSCRPERENENRKNQKKTLKGTDKRGPCWKPPLINRLVWTLSLSHQSASVFYVYIRVFYHTSREGPIASQWLWPIVM